MRAFLVSSVLVAAAAAYHFYDRAASFDRPSGHLSQLASCASSADLARKVMTIRQSGMDRPNAVAAIGSLIDNMEPDAALGLDQLVPSYVSEAYDRPIGATGSLRSGSVAAFVRDMGDGCVEPATEAAAVPAERVIQEELLDVTREACEQMVNLAHLYMMWWRQNDRPLSDAMQTAGANEMARNLVLMAYSYPVGGNEMEREQFTKRYLDRVAHYCYSTL